MDIETLEGFLNARKRLGFSANTMRKTTHHLMIFNQFVASRIRDPGLVPFVSHLDRQLARILKGFRHVRSDEVRERRAFIGTCLNDFWYLRN